MNVLSEHFLAGAGDVTFSGHPNPYSVHDKGERFAASCAGFVQGSLRNAHDPDPVVEKQKARV